MAGRRLSELLEEQQEPFLLHSCGETPCCSVAEEARRRICVYGCSNNGGVTARSAVRRALRRALRRWDDLAGCFPCAARESFRPLQRAGDTGGSNCGGVVTEFEDHGDGSWRRLSPVSVLDVLRYYSDEESSSPTLRYWEQEEDDQPLSKSGSSPPSSPLAVDDTTRASLAEAPTKTTSGKKFVEEQQMIIASRERIAGDIARVPALAELDLSSTGSAPEWQRRLDLSSTGSAAEWQRRLGHGEAARVGASIESMIFDDVRAEAVRDMLSLTA